MTQNPEMKAGAGVSRRDVLRGAAALLAAPALTMARAAGGKLGIAYTSSFIRLRQARRDRKTTPALPAEEYIDLCRSLGADGCQIDLGQLGSRDADHLRRIRAQVEDHGMFLEVSASGRLLEDAEGFASAAEIAQAVGASCLRVAINGRRYEEFFSRKAWHEFADHWKQALIKAGPMVDKHRLKVGIENHKEWLAEELADMLRQARSPYLGACVDFGNNLALLEQPMSLVEALAPHAVTTHLKDMAVRPYEKGFLLSEVPLGEGILPLADMMERLKRANPSIHFCLEMITRDPLQVPYRDDSYWASRDHRDEQQVAQFEARILSRSARQPLPRVSGLGDKEMLAREDENIRRCVAYYREHLAG